MLCNWYVCGNKFIQTIMSIGVANFWNYEEIRYKGLKFHYISPLQDSKSIRYIHKYSISKFIITIKFCKDLWRILPETIKLCFIWDFAKSMFILNKFFWTLELVFNYTWLKNKEYFYCSYYSKKVSLLKRQDVYNN